MWQYGPEPGRQRPAIAMSIQHPSVPTTDDRTGEAGLPPRGRNGAQPPAGEPRSLPRHLAPSQRRPGLLRSVLAACLLVVVVLAVGVVVVLGSIDRLEHPRSTPNAALGSPGSSRLGTPGVVVPAPGEQLLPDGDFENGQGPVRRQRGSDIAPQPGGAESAHSLRLSDSGPPTGQVGVLVDSLTRPPKVGTRYSANVQVKPAHPGQVVRIELIENVGGVRVNATPQLLRMPDTQWHEISVQHEVRYKGAVLGVEVAVSGVSPGEFVLIDNLRVTRIL
jgi:hypothetical protein